MIISQERALVGLPPDFDSGRVCAGLTTGTVVMLSRRVTCQGYARRSGCQFGNAFVLTDGDGGY